MRSVTRATEPIIRAHRRRWLAANDEVVSECFQILARYFHDTRNSLNFVSVHSCSQNLLISCMSAYKFQRRLTLLCLTSISGVKHLSALLAKTFQRRPPIFCTFSVEPLVIYNCALYNWKLSHHLRDTRLLRIPPFKINQCYRNRHVSIRYRLLPINVPQQPCTNLVPLPRKTAISV